MFCEFMINLAKIHQICVNTDSRINYFVKLKAQNRLRKRRNIYCHVLRTLGSQLCYSDYQILLSLDKIHKKTILYTKYI